MGTALISGRGAPCPAPVQCLEIDPAAEAEQARAQAGHVAGGRVRPRFQWASWWLPQRRGTGLALVILDPRAPGELI